MLFLKTPTIYLEANLQSQITYVSYKAKTANAATALKKLPAPAATLPAPPVKGAIVEVGTAPTVPLLMLAGAVPVGYTLVPLAGGATVLITKVVVGATTVLLLNEDTVALLAGAVVTVVTVTGAAEVTVVKGAAVPVTVLVTVTVPDGAELEMPNWVLYW